MACLEHATESLLSIANGTKSVVKMEVNFRRRRRLNGGVGNNSRRRCSLASLATAPDLPFPPSFRWPPRPIHLGPSPYIIFLLPSALPPSLRLSLSVSPAPVRPSAPVGRAGGPLSLPSVLCPSAAAPSAAVATLAVQTGAPPTLAVNAVGSERVGRRA